VETLRKGKRGWRARGADLTLKLEEVFSADRNQAAATAFLTCTMGMPASSRAPAPPKPRQQVLFAIAQFAGQYDHGGGPAIARQNGLGDRLSMLGGAVFQRLMDSSAGSPRRITTILPATATPL